MYKYFSRFINDEESGLPQDYDHWLEKLAPHDPVSQYRHNDTGEDNADAHMKRQVMGREVAVAITGGKLISVLRSNLRETQHQQTNTKSTRGSAGIGTNYSTRN